VISSLAPRQPAGAIIVLTAGAIFVASLLAAPRRGIVATAARRIRMRVRIAGEHLLEEAAGRPEPTLPSRAIDELARLRGWSPWLRRIVIMSLRRGGFVGRTFRGGLEITPAGIERGVRIARNHALWTQYLTSRADVAASHVDWSVDVVEHVLSEELVAELERELAASGEAGGGTRP
jgi:manganese/zinc/iron transport system permease protein